LIYLDTSVALAHLLAEDRSPPATLWQENLVSSRLLEYEAWTRLHAKRLARSHGDLLRQLVSRIGFLEMTATVLTRATEPFPVPVRTLDALHLASIEFLRGQGQKIALASYDDRLVAAALRLGIEVAEV
jgi:hypothetical protein